MSESLSSGYLPLWNPYINFGLPQYGDMSSGFWSPITWLVALTVGYNAYSFTIELLLYILTAGIGMYLLCRYYGMIKHVCMIAGMAYMCCGYMIGHLQHFNWLSGAAFLPFCICSYHKLQTDFSIKNLLAASLLFYLLVSSAHPGITIGALYFFLPYAVFVFFTERKNTSITSNILSFGKKNIALLLGILILCAGLIAGYADILPHITRGEKVNEVAAMAHPVSIQSSLSALMPLSIVKNDAFFATDLSMRNIYFSLTLFIFFCFGLFRQKNTYQKFFLFTGLGFFLLSMGGVFKLFAYDYLPLIGFVRLNGEFAIFALLCFILFSAFALNNFFETKATFSGALKIIYYVLELFFAGCIAWGLYKVNTTNESFVYGLKHLSTQTGMAQKLKFLLDHLSFYDTLWLQGIIQMLLLWFIKWCLANRHSARLLIVCITDIILASLLNIPFTGVGKASVAEVQAVLNKSPHGIVTPPLKLIVQNDTLNLYEGGLVGNWSFYNKQPGVKEFAFYPIELNNTKFVFADTASEFFYKPYIFTTGDSSKIMVEQFTPNKITANVTSNVTSQLVYQQNFYPHWYVLNNGQKMQPSTYKDVFLSTNVTSGTNKVSFMFDPSLIKKAMLFSAIAFVLYLVVIIILAFRSPYPSSPRQ